MTIRQPSSRPLRKVNAAALSGALATVVLWLIEFGTEVPTVVAAAITTLVAAGVAYLTPETSTPGVPAPEIPAPEIPRETPRGIPGDTTPPPE